MTAQITAELFTSLDLVVEEPNTWHFPWVDELMLAEVGRELAADALLVGHATYDSFAGAWPHRGDDVPLAAGLNAMPKYVVSDHITEQEAHWNNTRIVRPGGDLPAVVRELRVQIGGRITVAGSVSLVEQLLAAGELDELRLIVHPIVIGAGRRLFDDWTGDRIVLDHLGSSPLGRGARVDTYRPQPQEQ
jgi:dihydrofolate reductase